MRLRQQLLDIAAALAPDGEPTVLREWDDPVRLSDPEPVGRRSLCLVAVGTAASRELDVDDIVAAFTAAGWSAHGRERRGETWATARHEGDEVAAYQGRGTGLVTLTGWTPVVFTGRALNQPLHTRSIGGGVLCTVCHGWGVCLDCEGTGRIPEGPRGRCWCTGNNSGTGNCSTCRGAGRITSENAPDSWRQRGFPDPDHVDAFRQPPIEDGHDTLLNALKDVADRSCHCGEFRCTWRHALGEAAERLVLHVEGPCQGCATRRAYAFALPYRKLPGPRPLPDPPPCPLCAGTPIPVTGGLFFPGSPTMRARDLGLMAASRTGSRIDPGAPNWHCRSCGHEWHDVNERFHTRIVTAILDGVTES